MNYQQTPTGEGIMRDGTWIPADRQNRDWRVYLTWLAQGNSPDPPPESALIVAQRDANAVAAKGAIELVRHSIALNQQDSAVQQLEYAELDRALAATSALTAEEYPLLAALVGIDGADLNAVVTALDQRRTDLIQRIASIHAVRTQTQQAIAAATTAADAKASVENIAWPALPTPA